MRLTAEDGYTASRSYSVASPPGDGAEIDLTVERLEHGEVSTFLHDELIVGDEIEVRGPIGGWFVWKGDQPALLVGGGSGLVPLMSMLRHARNLGQEDRLHLVVSVRSPDELLYATELDPADQTIVYTRAAPVGIRACAGAHHRRRPRAARAARRRGVRVRFGRFRRHREPSPRRPRCARTPHPRRALRPDRLTPSELPGGKR